MSDNKIFEEIKRIIATETGIKEGEISRNSHLKDDLCIDSVDFVHVTVALEKHFEIKAIDPEWEDIAPCTVDVIENFIKSKLN